MNAYVQAWQRSFDYGSRSRRREYWLFLLVHLAILLLLFYFFGDFSNPDEPSGGVIATGYSLAGIFPSLALTIRRFHDQGRSGWWVLIGLLPVLGGLILLIFMLIDSKPEDNQWGPSPKKAALS